MKQILLMIAVVAMVGCGGKKAPESTPIPAAANETETTRVMDGPNSSSRQWPYLPNEFIPLDKFIVNTHSQLKLNGGKVNLIEFNAKTSDTELKYLPGMADVLTEQVHLYFGHSQITDVGLKELAKMKNLGSLELDKTQVTDAGVAELQKALPSCDIKYTPAK